MKIEKWPHEVHDLAREPAYVELEQFSILANAVEHLNRKLVAELPVGAKVLEVGCGVHSLVRDALPAGAAWDGIDVLKIDRKGQPVIATRFASVGDIPWPADSFDIVLANQSIEHWYEYGVSPSHGLAEIARVLKPRGRAYINFPIHLHGQKMFVTGDFDAIDREFERAGLDIVRRTAVVHSGLPPYAGWRLCGFPDFVVEAGPDHESTSYIVEYVAARIGGPPEKPSAAASAGRKIGPLRRHLQYGWRYLLWKVTRRLFSPRSGPDATASADAR